MDLEGAEVGLPAGRALLSDSWAGTTGYGSTCCSLSFDMNIIASLQHRHFIFARGQMEM